ncbi:hypothetical protein HPG69_000110 [Diceros bicornis minor]|uniref:Uncharacterized protein n=1 Tax=Diceros bicornis minor TaxID=77932 RepID=A0A7J7EUZ2_DICBM|nr:hypothetical protein HPG69_000110 [Diceros bicornis minor]
MLGYCPEAQSVASVIVRMDFTNVGAPNVRGLCLYSEDLIEKAVQALRMGPDQRRPALLAERLKHLKQRKKMGMKHLKKEITS